MKTKFDTKTGALMLIGVAVIVLIVIYAFMQTPAAAPGAPSQSSPTPSYAAQGQIVQGFPTSLILDPAATVNNSYSIDYSTSLNQYTAQFNSALSMASLYASYQSYFSKNGWTVTGQVTKYPTLRGIAATNASSYANVSITVNGKGAQVTISYENKN